MQDGRILLIRQADHADLAGQFAAHFGNEQFTCLRPYEPMVRATTYHDSHFHDVEAKLPIDEESGHPFGHRQTPVSQTHQNPLIANIAWLSVDDPLSGLIVSKHHSGLPQNRYGLVSSWQTRGGAGAKSKTMKPDVAAFVARLEREQAATEAAIVEKGISTAEDISTNYCLLQFFDLLSLYLCCDGYDNGQLVATSIGPVPMDYASGKVSEIRIDPQSDTRIRLDPYPFDVALLRVSLPTRVLHKMPGTSVAQCREAYLKADRKFLEWDLVP